MRFLTLIFSAALLAACGPELSNQWTLTDVGIRVTVHRDPYRLEVFDGNGNRVLESADGMGADAQDGYAPVAWTTGDFEWKEGIITKGQYMFKAHLDPWRETLGIDSAERSEHTLRLRGRSDGAFITLTHVVSAGKLRVEARIEGAKPRAWAFAFRSPADEGFLGMGERYTRTNFRGVSIYSWPEEGGIGKGEGSVAGEANPWPNGESMTYFPMPYFLSTRGYSFWLDSTWRNTFDFASETPGVWRVWDTGPNTAFEVFVPQTAAKNWAYALIDQFTATVGRPMLPPPWVLGPRRRVGSGDVADGKGEVEAMRDEDLAITAIDDAVHVLPNGSHIGREAELRTWTQRAHALGYKVMCYYNSLFADVDDSPIRATIDESKEKGYFLRDKDGKISPVELVSGRYLPVLQLDFTNPDAVTWYQGLLEWGVALGYDGWMQDFGEYVQPLQVGLNGMTGEELHNLYPVLYDKAVYDHMESGPMKGNWLSFARAGYTGSPAFVPAIWGGDPAASFDPTDGLPSMIPAAVNLGISGAPTWGGDIGGFHCSADGGAAADGELWTRWIEQGALTPIMQDQNACVFNKDGVEKASIWTSPDAKEAWRKYARLHTRLFPYLYSYSHAAVRTGAPLVRHLFLEHPDRSELASVADEYYFGEALLVAPVVARGARKRKVVFPAGAYLDWDTGTIYEAGDAVVAAPLEKLPLYLRDGFLVPLLDASIDTLMPEDNTAVVGPTDVADVYDVAGFLADATGATFRLWDGGTLSVTRHGAADFSSLGKAASEAAFAACTKTCWRVTTVGVVKRVSISQPEGTLSLGGLTLQAETGRRTRWELYLR